ncbi:MAG: hypothetical protein MCSN_4080 [Candidatus Microsyncoccus archaeolyticus]|nr:MAG: hypothetical protein MCSN_4080 [Candidatus Parcubacteria bacterium]
MILNQKEQKIISIILKQEKAQSSSIYEELLKLEESISFVTVKRILSELVKKDFLIVSGSGRSTNYSVSINGRVFFDVNAHEYCSVDPDKRYGFKKYNFELFSSFPKELFTKEELDKLNNATTKYELKLKDFPPSLQKKELERFIIELSWKSSKIEGNTYTLLDTEKLILENQVAAGKTIEETQMILNHKDAFNFIYENSKKFENVTRKNIEELHKILIKKLNINSGLRKKIVGITGSIYKPLDNIYQIEEAIESLGVIISKLSDPYSKALMALLGVSYIQPFDDGNKRTSRLIADAILLSNNLPPLSYRSVDEKEYKEAILVFYELNSINPFKKIFIEQYYFTVENYSVFKI